MIACKECKKTITGNRFYYIDAANHYLCSDICRLSYAKREKENEEKEKLHNTIYRIFGITSLNVQQRTELKRFREKENMTNKQISSVLHYIYDIKGIAPYGLSLYLVPKYKDEAKEWYLENQRRQEYAKAIAEKKPVEMRRVNKVNTTRDKKRAILEINPEDV